MSGDPEVAHSNERQLNGTFVKPPTPLGALYRGLAAGVVGTDLMTAWQELSTKLQSQATTDAPEPEPQPEDPWEQASAPAKVAKRVGEGVFHKNVSPELIPLLSNVMHWGYGTGWGAVYGITAPSARRSPGLRAGMAFGTAVWLMSYVQLVPMGLYEPPWKYPPKDLALDLSYHLVYGGAVASAYRVLERR
jgi:uncharacterized membrane protein YagU involved in acid resistance